jgi:hypothetical protein
MKLFCVKDEDYERYLENIECYGHLHSNYDEIYDYTVDISDEDYNLFVTLIHKDFKIRELKEEISRLKQIIEAKNGLK